MRLTNLKNPCLRNNLRINNFEGKSQNLLHVIGKLIYLAHVEPLHIKNNAWQYFFKGVLKEAVGKSNLPDSCKKVFRHSK